MIHFEGLSKWYKTKAGRNYILKDVNITLPMDKSIGVLGRNGAGKSTFIRMLGGSELPKSGSIQSDLRISWPLGLQGGVQGQMSGRENARFISRIHGYSDTRAMEDRVADFADIGQYFDEPMKSYSSGMRSRVMLGITVALDFQFDVLLIDEITAVGDAAFRAKSERVLKEKFSSTKVIMVNHSMEQLRKFCDAGLLIRNGKLEYFDSLEDAIVEYES
ncbi:ABC transporter ATP-binding protein [Oceanobacter kriegii]|uniref:ABC transporter ATP-binding protein n=1 Tax=Oceanobacter kriegii TaxID=64972 RepID=UPI000480F318|nr:ABC transporter ATP-binding protein [Oceanobacter kriegii]